ncbi:MAG: hypothetical protein D6B25_20055 [Desulfobulbaceae bacterium]|nr:MAG: hypothetical protein D6B25_20055 [Desulfobulbaceae bacterium]
MIRHATFFLLFCLLFVCFNAALWIYSAKHQQTLAGDGLVPEIVGTLGLTDLCLATDARYIRHLSVSDPLSPYMNHPGALEHFPSSALYVPR